HFVADGVIAPNLGDLDLIVLGQATSDVDHSGGYIKVERRSKLPEVRPLRERFQMVHRFGRLDLDHGLQPLSTLERRQHKVGKKRGAAGAHWSILLSSGFIPASYLRRLLVCSSRMIRSCSSCSRTGLTRIGLTKRLHQPPVGP